MANALYHSTEFAFDAHMTNGTPGAGVRISVSLYDTGALQLYMYMGVADATLYPNAATLRRLGEFLVAAADGAEAAASHSARGA